MITDLLQHSINGLLDGGSYALVGLGLSLTFGSLRRLNLAYGAGAMLAAYVGNRHEIDARLVRAAAAEVRGDTDTDNRSRRWWAVIGLTVLLVLGTSAWVLLRR